jgi:hypothetical protein
VVVDEPAYSILFLPICKCTNCIRVSLESCSVQPAYVLRTVLHATEVRTSAKTERWFNNIILCTKQYDNRECIQHVYTAWPDWQIISVYYTHYEHLSWNTILSLHSSRCSRRVIIQFYIYIIIMSRENRIDVRYEPPMNTHTHESFQFIVILFIIIRYYEIVRRVGIINSKRTNVFPWRWAYPM